MADTARLLLVERVLGPPNEPDRGRLMDLLMLVGPGGLERTEPEFRAMLGSAGFQLARIIPTPAPQSIIEAVPA